MFAEPTKRLTAVSKNTSYLFLKNVPQRNSRRESETRWSEGGRERERKREREREMGVGVGWGGVGGDGGGVVVLSDAH